MTDRRTGGRARRRGVVGVLALALLVPACKPLAGGSPGGSGTAAPSGSVPASSQPASSQPGTSQPGTSSSSSSAPPTSTTTTTTTTPPATTTPPSNAVPTLTVTEVMTGLTKPWDVVELPGGTLLTGERSGAVFALTPGGPRRPVAFDTSTLYASGETGLMGLELSADFATDRTLYVCQGRLASGASPNRIEVARYTLDTGVTALTRTGTVVDGMPTATGRHGGCRVRDLGDGSLVIGTGDAAIGTNPQDRSSLGGKTLRVDKATGKGWPGNPFLTGGGDPRIQSFGHRNVQGLAVRPGTDTLYSVEQGTYRDDEVNVVTAGADYGYNPVPLYNESVPMTRPGGTPAVWSSGPSTIATSGAAFTQGPAWGRYSDWLAVGVQKGTELMLLQLPADGGAFTARVDVLTDRGRLRSVTAAADGSLLVTTDNGGGADKVLRVTPS